MKNYTFSHKKYALLYCIMMLSRVAFSQTADFKVQHLQDDIGNSGGTNTGFTPVSSINSAFILANNNRLANAGQNGNGSNFNGDDLSGARVLTANGTVTYYRESGSNAGNMRFNSSIWEFVGPPGSPNEMIVRGRYAVNLNGTTNSTTQALAGVSNANKCIPFITGIRTNVSNQGSDSGTAIAYLENASTLRVQKGTNGNNVVVYVTVVEFTGSNWTVLHGDSGNASSDSGFITLRDGSAGTGTATNVSSWNNAVIFGQHRGDMTSDGLNDAIADNWPIFDPGSNNQSVEWVFNADHDSDAANSNRHFVHVLANSGMNVTRYQDTNSAADVTSIDISTAGLSNINEAFIVGSSISNGGGQAYGRGWRNYYLNSTTQASHWSHRSGNSMNHEIQIVDLSSLTTASSYCASNGSNTDFEYISRVQLNTINNPSDFGTTSIGYSNFTAISTNLTRSSTYNITITPTWPGTVYREGYRVWIDYNNDGDFDDGGEQVISINPTTAAPVSGSFTIPVGATIGTTRMRVSMRYDALPANCGTFYYGEVEDYTVNIISPSPQPEINLVGNGNTINDGDTTPVVSDDTDFGSIGTGGTIDHTFTIQNIGTATLNLTGGTPLVDISGNAAFTIVTQPIGNTITAGNNRTFVVRFAPTANGTVTANISIDNNDSNENPYNFRIQGTGVAPLTEGPGGITADLELWLKGTDGLGYSDGNRVSLWADQGRGANAIAPVSAVRPTYRNHPTQNINFNPVVNFDNSYNPVPLDGDFSFDNPNTQFLQGTSGYYSQDIFVVLIPNVTINATFGSMDVFCGDENISANETDATGIGLGAYSARFSNEILCYAHGTTSGGNGYGVAEIGTGSTYSNVGIINVRNNIGATRQQLFYNAINKETTQNDVADFANVNDSRYWIGRSEGWEASTDARIAEIVTYSSRKTDANLTQERNRIQSYLAVKYGITLGVNGTSQDYVNSDGTVIWDVNTGVPANDVFNQDIAGIGRDDVSDLHQKQSRSVNNAADGTGRTQGVLTMGISSIYDTNSQNPNSLGNKQFLMWGNDGVNLNNNAREMEVNMSSDITPALETNVLFRAIARTWKVVENGNGSDIPSVEVAILKTAVRTVAPPGDGSYLMFISDIPNFDPTADYRIMTEDVNELGENILKTNYDFDGTKYITFGWAPERVFERSISLNGTTNYIDMEDNLNLNTSGFTVSAWIKRDVNSGGRSILSKRNTGYTDTRGYDFRILGDGRFNVRWKNSSGTNQELTTSVAIPLNIWHNIAVIYNGVRATIYIDGVADTFANLTPPATSTHSFLIGAGGKGTIDGFFHGSIDEVRIWNTALTVDQLRFVMNQEIRQNTGFVRGSYFQGLGINPTKNDIASVPWSQLAAYYPMTTYTYTNTKDESGNGIQGALRLLRTVDRQTAPLPYISNANGNWTTKATWKNGNLQNIPGAPSIVNPIVNVDWNIVQTNHNITIDKDNVLGRQVSTLGLLVNSNTLTVNGAMGDGGSGNALTVTHYLNLDGKIDLQGESQLIQTLGSDLDPTSSGELDRDQQGTQDQFTYNYWASPVGTKNTTTNNNGYTLPTVLRDGTNANTPQTVTFLTSGYNGNTSPLRIADYWIWKFANRLDDDYSAWQHVRSTGTILAGEGYTMKGVANTSGNVSLEQNYVFSGKPNNGTIGLTLNAGNDYLVGNPYPSAIDADQFILDNSNTIDGTLYFWEHWGGGSHNLAEYQGGYAERNLSGETPAASYGTNDPDVGTGGTPTKLPGRYIAVSQGFFVVADSDGGTINFNNGQRIYRKESSGNSIFMRSMEPTESSQGEQTHDNDTRMKFRFGFYSVNTVHRQLLLTIDDNASEGIDWGYDGKLYEDQMDDMYWMVDDIKLNIQGRNVVHSSTVIPLGIHTADEGQNTIRIDGLENVPESINIYVHDNVFDIYHNLRQSDYAFSLPAGEYLDRFEITFTNPTLGLDDNVINTIDVFFNNDSESIVLLNPEFKTIKAIELFNILGQSVYTVKAVESTNYAEFRVKNLSSGSYILKMITENGTISKKVLVQ